jgi:putative transcriptional regulator
MNGQGRSSFALGRFDTSTYHNATSKYHTMTRDKDFESKLMRLRSLRNMSQADLAEALGVSRTTVMRWETGRAEPNLTIRQVRALLKALDITFDELPDDFGPQRIAKNN